MSTVDWDALRTKEAHIQVQYIQLGDKIEVGGHLTEVVGVDKTSFSSSETPYVIVHALDLANRVYEIKFRWNHPLIIQKKVKNANSV